MTAPLPSAAVPPEPYLEFFPEQGGATVRIPLTPLPFRIGRSRTAHWVVSSPRVSKDHAEILRSGDDFYVRDLSSSNGTFVNGRQIDKCRLADGDVVHVAQMEFVFGYGNSLLRGVSTAPMEAGSPASVVRERIHLRELLARACVLPLFQPIVDLSNHSLLGYEGLARGNHPELSPGPEELFRLAERWQMAAELSRTFRRAAADQLHHLPPDALVFLNGHPSEIHSAELAEDLDRLQGLLGEKRRVVLEIPEQLVTDLAVLREFRDDMHDRNVRIAFDDFGAGQDRLAALGEATPDYIKLDRGLVGGLAQAPGRLEVVRSLCQVSRDLGVLVIAEGIETAEEAEACRSLGCHFGQGYFFGRPQSVLVRRK